MMNPKTKKTSFKKITWLIVRVIIIANFIGEIIDGPFIGAAKDVSLEVKAKRRHFTAETWVAISGLVIYIAVIYRDKIRKYIK